MSYQPDLCIYHKNCTDGFAAAWAVHRRWMEPNQAPQFLEATYGDPIPSRDFLEGRNVLIVDFSWPEDELRAMASHAKSVVVLDHHATAEEALEALPHITRPTVERVGELFSRQNLEDGLTNLLVEFDMDRSGAGMAWDFCFGPTRRPPLIDLVEDRDLWRFKHEVTRGLHVYLSLRPFSFERFSEISSRLKDDSDTLIEDISGALVEYEDSIVEHIVESSGFFGDFKDYSNVAMTAECPQRFASQVGHALLDKYPDAQFAAVISTRRPGQDAARASLRSRDDRTDVSEVAKRFGGGGHRNAAGCKL